MVNEVMKIEGSDVMDMGAITEMVGVSPRVVYAAFKSGDLAGRNLGGRKGWVTTRNSILDWVESRQRASTRFLKRKKK